MMRKVIQITQNTETERAYNTILALCDDGTIWMGWFGPEWSGWKLIENIPQGKAQDYVSKN